MANIPCPNAITCPDATGPLGNFSSEANDGQEFFAISYPITGSDPLGGPDDPVPPPYLGEGCIAAVESTQSQDAANQAALNHGQQCSHPTKKMFSSAGATCTIFCADGTPFSYALPPGWAVALTQALADEIALSDACTGATQNLICLPSIPGGVCQSTAFSAPITPTGKGPFVITVQSGDLPPGLSLSQTSSGAWVLSGTPSAPGNYTFTLQATNLIGINNTRTYTIDVMGITNAGTLPNGTPAGPYSFQFNVTGGTPPYVWTNAGPPSGPLPPGLTLSTSGLLSGTPIQNGIFPFTVIVTDAVGRQCQAGATVQIGACNVDQNGTGFCPANPQISFHADIAQGTFCANSQNQADSEAQSALTNAIAAGLKSQSCTCTVTTDFGGRSGAIRISSTCDVHFTAIAEPSGVPVWPPGGFTAGPGNSPFDYFLTAAQNGNPIGSGTQIKFLPSISIPAFTAVAP